MLRKLFNDETGAVVSAELVLIITICFCAAATGWAAIASSVVSELNDVSEMIGTMDQSYSVNGYRTVSDANAAKGHGQCAAFGYNDGDDDCDCKGIIVLTTCGKTQTPAAAASTDANTGG